MSFEDADAASYENWEETLQFLSQDEPSERELLLVDREKILEGHEKKLKKQERLLGEREKELDEREMVIKVRERELEQAKEAFELEMQVMKKKGKSSDVLHLNVGGETTLAVLRSTLTSVEEAMLAVQFSGRWDDSLERDRNGNFFIDQPMELFKPMIDYLRRSKCETPRAPPINSPDATFFENERSYHDFLRMVEYYGMTPGIYPTRIYLHYGLQDDSTIEGNRVIAREFSTFTLEQYGHSRRIKSFEVTLGDTDGFQIGWLCKERWERCTSYPVNFFGIAAHSDSMALCVAWQKLKFGSITMKSETTYSVERGTVVRCEAPKNNQMPKWFVDGKEVEYNFEGHYNFIYSQFAGFSGLGEWSVTNVEYWND